PVLPTPSGEVPTERSNVRIRHVTQGSSAGGVRPRRERLLSLWLRPIHEVLRSVRSVSGEGRPLLRPRRPQSFCRLLVQTSTEVHRAPHPPITGEHAG